MKIKAGIYEQVINSALKEALSTLDENQFEIVKRRMDESESKVILARYMQEVLERGLQLVREKSDQKDGLHKQVEACNDIIRTLGRSVPEEDIDDWIIDEEAEQILAIFEKQLSELKRDWQKMRPETSISISSLFTGSRNEPQMVTEIKREILSADRIDLLVSFIKWSGLRLIIGDLQEFCETKPLRVITTTYMGATEEKAITELSKLPNTEIKISYDTRSSRLHAKAYIFHRDNGYSTAYVGSSNLSSSAMSGGLEWNVKVTNKDLPHVIRNVQATFDTYWDDRDFSSFTIDVLDQFRKALDRESKQYDIQQEYLFDIEPFPFQKEILEELEAERKIHNRYRNLLVAATGTGKTVISAFDYKRFCMQNPGQKNRLLFLAHREEILKQSLLCFRGVLRDHNFGELFVGNHRPTKTDHLFMSIQTFTSQEFADKTDPQFYDFIVVDETHHGAAPTYHNVLTHYRPKVLLGLTATPERMDGSDIKDYYDGVIASEIRLPEAINRNLLVPFQYFCVTDNVDLSNVRFERGKYDISELNERIGRNQSRASAVLQSLHRYVSNIADVRALGFCVTKDHAQFMADFFSNAGVPSVALTDESGREERSSAQSRLTKGEVKVIFTVDLYNEGVDIPAVNTVLFLRPTESLTVFLQQLGRGLRLYPGKEELTVLDFIAQSNKKYNFERKFQALAEVSTKSITDQIEKGFTSLPKGCYIQMEKVAQEYVLENIRNATVNKSLIMNKIRTYEGDTGKPLQLGPFLDYNSLHLYDIYSRGTFSFLKVQANVSSQVIDPDLESIYNRFLARISHIDSRRLISVALDFLQNDRDEYDQDEEKFLLMLYYNHPLGNKGSPRSQGYENILDFMKEIRNSDYREELIEFFKYRYNKIRFVDKHVDLGYHNVLDLHCSYTRDEILAGLGVNTQNHRQSLREGVFYSKSLKTDLLFGKLQKSEKDFSPTTMYEDYAINEELFHWQSQSSTSEESPTAQRYFNHQERGSQVLLFVRKSPKNEAKMAAPFIYLGRMNYVRHYGSRPVSIVWKLDDPMPAHILEISRVTNL